MSKSKYTIKVAEIIREVRPDSKSSFFGRRVFVDSTLEIAVEPLRGQSYQSEVESFYVRVAPAHRGNRVWSAFEQRVGGENWRADLVGALAAAREAGERHKKTQDERFKARLEAGQAKRQYADKLIQLIGANVNDWDVTQDDKGFPTGLKVDVLVTGTPEQVAEKIRKIRAITI